MFAVSKLATSTRMLTRCGRMCYSSTSVLFERFTIPVPPMGESIKNGLYVLYYYDCIGTLVQWEKKPGDFVELDDIIAVIETDKVVFCEYYNSIG